MDCWIKFLIISLLSPSIASAGLFDILDEKYIENIDELPPSVDLIPDKNWQPSEEYFSDRCRRKYSPYFVSGWLDVVGFERMAKIDGIYYTNISPASSAIIRYETNVCALGYPRYHGGWDYKLETYQHENQYVAKLTATAILYHYYDGIEYYDNITKTFSDSETIPLQYINVIHPIVNIIEYENPVEQKIIIHVSELNASKIIVQYGNRIFTKIQKAYHVEKTTKGVHFVNATSLESWNIQGSGIARFQDSIVINVNVSTMDYSELNITALDIFGSMRVQPSAFNITRVTYEPERIVYNPLLYGFVGILCTLFGASIYLIGRIQF